MFFRNAMVWQDGSFTVRNMVWQDGVLRTSQLPGSDASVIDNCLILPGLADVHVHLREPGFSYKETILTGTMAAARGGYTRVCPMPNLDPVPDCPEHLQKQLDIIEKDARIRVFPYGAITRGEQGNELSDMEALAPLVCAFSDDGRGVQSEDMMRAAMKKAGSLGKIIAAHCEVNTLLNGGYIHDGAYAKAHGHAGICSESEYAQIARDIALAEETGCAYHVCHISTKESVDIIRKAKARGVNITCETAPHYLLLSDKNLQEDGRFKMNPPLRSEEDRLALLQGLTDGTIDMIATDHAPHSREEKSRGLKSSAMGIVGLECAFALLYTYLVLPGIISPEKLVQLMAVNPVRRFFPQEETSGQGEFKNCAVFETQTPWRIDPSEFLSKGKATPFAGWEVKGRCLLTVCNGNPAWQEK